MEVIEAIRFSVSDETLIISESTSYPGTLRNIIRSEICSRAREKKLKFAVAPERVDPGNKSFSLKNTPRVVGALDQESLEEALSFYQDFCDEVIPVSSAEVAETAKLLENSFRLVNISFVNEVDTYCSKLGITTREVIEAASTKPFGYMPFFPGIGIGGHCIPIDPMYLSYHAESIGADMKLINLSKRIDNERTERVAKFIKQNNSGNLPITLIGLGYKSGTSDTRESPSIRILNLLRHYNFSVDWIDSQVLEWNGETSKREVLGMAVLIREDEAFNVAEHIRKGKPCIDCTGTYGHIKGVTSISI
jgi:UDP-N-acetyl-D-glucosamine dehydrogenase